jgi:hypothetical protein
LSESRHGRLALCSTAELDGECVRRVRTDIARKQTGVTVEKPHNGESLNLEVAARALRRFLFATCILLGLAFAVVCYAEMLGVVQFEQARGL